MAVLPYSYEAKEQAEAIADEMVARGIGLGGGSGGAGGDASAINQLIEIQRLTETRDRLPSTLGSGGGLKVEILSGGSGGSTTDFAETNARLGATNETAAASPTATSGLNGLLRFFLNRFTYTANGVKTDGSAVVQPVSGSVNVNNLPTTQTVGGSVAITNFPAIQPVLVGNFPGTQPISASSLPLPNNAATEATLAVVRDRTPPLGQAAAAGSIPVALSNDGPFSTNFGLRSDAIAATDTPTDSSFFGLFKRLLSRTSSVLSAISPDVDNAPLTKSPFYVAGKAVNPAVYAPAYTDGDSASLPIDRNSGALLTFNRKLTSADDEIQTQAKNYDIATVTNVASVTVAVVLVAANPNRRWLSIDNSSTATLFLKFGTGVATNSYTRKILPNSYVEIIAPYSGIVTGVWDTANGTAYISEVSG